MKDQKISMRQMMTLLFIALLSLGAEIIPGMTGAGAVGWLVPILAMIPLLLFLYFGFRKGEKRRGAI